MIKKVIVQNFRSLKNVVIPFEKDLTVIVGENDCGKTSIIDAIKIVFNNENVELDDFYHDANQISIEIEMDDKSIIKKIKREDEEILSPEILIKLNKNLINQIKEHIESEEFKEKDENNKKEKLKLYANDLGVKYSANIGVDTLKSRIMEKIEELEDKKGSDLIIPGKVPESLIYFLDGKHFQDVKKFFSEMFFKNKKRSIWTEKDEKSGLTLENIIKSNLDEYSKNLSAEIEEKGITDELKKYLPELNGIVIKSKFEPRDIQIDLKVQLLEENDDEINIDKKGDGTKRKITMALLKYGKDITKDLNPIYIFDEPDTHLHVKSQIDLLKIIRNISNNSSQVIITTHSPFILNSVTPRQVRLLINNGDTKLKHIKFDKEVEWIFSRLGIENLNLFFSRKILIVEGETEKNFLPTVQERFFDATFYNILVKLVNRRGITDIPRFAEVLSDFVEPTDIYILTDNDGDKETVELMNKLKISSDNIVKVGTKEFEDSFEPETIYNAWKKFVESKGRDIGPEWTIENIKNLKNKCINENKKFSKELRSLNSKCSVKLTKPIFGAALAENIERSDMDIEIDRLLQELNK